MVKEMSEKHTEKSDFIEPFSRRTGQYSQKQVSTADMLIKAALPHIPFDGWGENALNRAAMDANIAPPLARTLFPDTMKDMIYWASRLSDEEMCLAYQRDHNNQDLSIRERIATLLMIGFSQNLPHRDALRRAMPFLLNPLNMSFSLRLLYYRCDAIWRMAGDTSTDWNFYSKRSLLIMVYSPSLLVYLNDNSDNLQITDAFLRRRINDVLQIPKIKAKMQTAGLGFIKPIRHARKLLQEFANIEKYSGRKWQSPRHGNHR